MNIFIAGADFACCFFLLIIIISLLLLNKKEKKYVYYMISAVGIVFFCASDSIAYFMDEMGGNTTLHFYSNLFSYIGIDIILPSFVYYLTAKIKETIDFSIIHARIILVLSIIDLLIITLGAYTGILFKIENQSIVYGPLIEYVGFTQLIVSAYFMVLLFINRENLSKKFIKTVSFYFILPLVSVFLEIINPSLSFTYMISALIFLVVFVVVVQEDLQSSAISERIMYTASMTDNLTGMLNRRAYSECIAQFSNSYPENFVYVALDVNGLKTVNDNIGHAAGDEIIKGAAECMESSFGAYGKTFRTGGDEFTAILSIPEEEINTVWDNFENTIANWHGELVDSLSISFGYVKADEAQNMSIHEVSVKADERMYAAKAAFYKSRGVDRRGQFEAHVALCNLYTKIIKINVTDDTYQIINMDEENATDINSFKNKISTWLNEFGKSGQVYSDDVDEYLQKTNIQYLREYFKSNKKILSIFYRRKFADNFKQVVMEIVPTGNYTDDNQELFLYVKSIDC